MKQLFIYLLKKYSKTEKNRLIIYRQLHDSTSSDYSEQTETGNLFNSSLEFLDSSPIKEKDLIKRLLINAIDNLPLNSYSSLY